MGGSAPCRVLLVKPSGAERVRAVLSGAGFDVVDARDAQVALRLLRGAREIDLLLCDAEMPGIDGFDLCRAARANPGRDKLGAVLLFEDIGASDRRRLDVASADLRAWSPDGPAALLDVVREALDARTPVEPAGAAELAAFQELRARFSGAWAAPWSELPCSRRRLAAGIEAAAAATRDRRAIGILELSRIDLEAFIDDEEARQVVDHQRLGQDLRLAPAPVRAALDRICVAQAAVIGSMRGRRAAVARTIASAPIAVGEGRRALNVIDVEAAAAVYSIVSLCIAALGFYAIRFEPPPGRWSLLRTSALVVTLGLSCELVVMAGLKAHAWLLGDKEVPAASRAWCFALALTVLLGLAAIVGIGLVLSP